MLHKTSFILLLTIGLNAQAQTDCNDIYRQAQEADLETLKTLYQTARRTPSCDDVFRTNLGKRVAKHYLQQVQSELAQDPEANVEPLLRQSVNYARHWQALAMLGDLHDDQKDYYQAAQYYQEALDVIADTTATPKPPLPVQIGKIFKKAERSRLLADRYVPATVTRSGEPGGLAASSIRGFTPEEVAIPVTFQYDSAAIDVEGEKAAADMLDYLTRQGSPAITLIGHTDPRGSNAYNLVLSRRRAEAVEAFLTARGYPSPIRSEGRGEKAPPKLDNRNKYTQDEIYHLHRRVELIR